ncbi:SDR family oxidoreductase [Litorivicinus sp.]|nr:SDR family oxidoreductase [Litorivicinus sp.]
MTSRVLLIGASSMLGNQFRNVSSHKNELICQFNRPNPAGLDFSITDPDECFKSLSKIKPDVILNFAAATDVDWCERHEDEAFIANATIPLNIQKWIDDSDAQTYVVNISTDQVYNGQDSKASREDETAPVNAYGRSKLVGEQSLNIKNSCALRTNFFGKSLVQKNSITDWIIAKTKDGSEITGFSDVYFSPISIGTLVLMIDKCIDERPFGALNLGSNRGISKDQFIREFLTRSNLDTSALTSSSIDSCSSLTRRPKNMVMNSRKFYSSLCIDPIDLDREIQYAVEEYQHEAV